MLWPLNERKELTCLTFSSHPLPHCISSQAAGRLIPQPPSWEHQEPLGGPSLLFLLHTGGGDAALLLSLSSLGGMEVKGGLVLAWLVPACHAAHFFSPLPP